MAGNPSFRNDTASHQEKRAKPGLSSPLVETIKSKDVSPLFIWIKDSSAMLGFMKAFTTQLRDRQHLDIVLGSLQTDPHQKYALLGSFEVHQPPLEGKRKSEELATVSIYQDSEGRMVMKINFASSPAKELVHPAISPALSSALKVQSLKLPVVFCEGTFDFDTAESGAVKTDYWSETDGLIPIVKP